MQQVEKADLKAQQQKKLPWSMQEAASFKVVKNGVVRRKFELFSVDEQLLVDKTKTQQKTPAKTHAKTHAKSSG